MSPQRALPLGSKLFELLSETRDAAGAEFSGIGVIVTDAPQTLPTVPLRRSSRPPVTSRIVDQLASICQLNSEYHDGFHILDSTLHPTHVSQYFSPPIVPDIVLDYSKRFGGRYVAALFGSVLPGVLLTGVASDDFGIAVFQGGLEQIYEPKP